MSGWWVYVAFLVCMVTGHPFLFVFVLALWIFWKKDK
jgi:hypothetical protein